MKKLFSFIPILLIIILLGSCSTKDPDDDFLMEYRFSTVGELAAALIKIDSLCQAHEVMAYMDTLPNGLPDTNGEVIPLSLRIGYIYELVMNEQLIEAVYDIYRFDTEPFSLISFLMKAQMAGNISPAVMAQILVHIPLPPIVVPIFVPPLQPIPAPVCLCDNPRVKIRVTWAYGPSCGNNSPQTSGYAANNTLSNMKAGTWFRLDAEMHDCKCPGGITWTSTVTTTSTSYGYSAPPGPSVGLTSYSSGTFTVTFKGVCACNGKEATATFTITF